MLETRELNVVLAALRLYQRALGNGTGISPAILQIATNSGTALPLDATEIDALCERLNIGGHFEPTPKRGLFRIVIDYDDPRGGRWYGPAETWLEAEQRRESRISGDRPVHGKVFVEPAPGGKS
jgi:DNA-binding Xre family transcriptional regulator